MATAHNEGIHAAEQVQAEPDTYQQIRDALDSLMGDLKNVEGGLTFTTLRECDVYPDRLDGDFVSALYCFRDLLSGLYDRGDKLVSRMMELELSVRNADNEGGR